MRSSLSTFFAWCISEGFLEPPGPVAGTDKATEGSRDRVLTDTELAAIWRALGPDDYGDIVRLLILTGQRREEIGALRWSEVDVDRGLLMLSATRTKNKRQHEVPLAPMARGILAAEAEAMALCSVATVRADGVCGRPRSIGAWRTRSLGVSTISGVLAQRAWPSLALRLISSRRF